MIEAMRMRKSIRTFKKTSLTVDDISIITSILKKTESCKGPFGNSAQFFIYINDPLKGGESKKIGTYGFVKNAPAFIGGRIQNSFEAMIDFGFLFEKIILELTKKGYGTVWLGGSFHREDFVQFIKNDEIIPCISPVGYAAEKSTIMDHMIRAATKANHRKPFVTLFFENTFDCPISENLSVKNSIDILLNLVRLAPSASNHQPWRILVRENEFAFFLKRTPNYATSLSYDIQGVDMGIAICHFMLALDENKMNYSILKSELNNNFQDDLIYILSFSLDK